MSDLSLIVFDGYSGRIDTASEVVSSLATASGSSGTIHRNARRGPDDTLGSRFHRFVSWLESGPAGVHESLHFLAFSMGCQVAIRAAIQAAASTRLAGVELIAPDPKYRRCALDRIEVGRGERPAFDDARQLWLAESAGPAFTAALAETASSVPCRVVYSRADEVAEWPENVELMKQELAGTKGISWIEAEPGRTIRDKRVTVSVQHGDAIHDSLARSVRFD